MTIQGILSRPALNQKTITIIRQDSMKSGRWVVNVKGGASMSIKAMCVSIASKPRGANWFSEAISNVSDDSDDSLSSVRVPPIAPKHSGGLNIPVIDLTRDDESKRAEQSESHEGDVEDSVSSDGDLSDSPHMRDNPHASGGHSPTYGDHGNDNFKNSNGDPVNIDQCDGDDAEPKPMSKEELIDQYMIDHLQRPSVAPITPGTANVGSPYGRNASVFAVGSKSVFWTTTYAADVLKDPWAYACRVGMTELQLAENISTGPPVDETPGTKFLVRCGKPGDTPVLLKDLWVSVNGSYDSRGLKESKPNGTVYKILVDISTKKHEWWEKRRSKLMNTSGVALKCPCGSCRGVGDGTFQMKITMQLGAKNKDGTIQPGALVLLEYIGEENIRQNMAHGLAHDQNRGTERTFKSTRDKAYDERRNNKTKPIIIAVESRKSSDSRERFASDARSRDATRGAASNRPNSQRGTESEFMTIMARLNEEAEAERNRVPGFTRVIQSVNAFNNDIIIGLWTKESFEVRHTRPFAFFISPYIYSSAIC